MNIKFKVRTGQTVNGYTMLPDVEYLAKSEDYVRQGGERIYFLHLVISHPKGIKQGICPLPMWNKLNDDDLIIYTSVKPEVNEEAVKELKRKKKALEEKEFNNGFYRKNRSKDLK